MQFFVEYHLLPNYVACSNKIFLFIERDQPQQSTFEAVQTRLEAIEEKNAEATFIQAQAINNLAAAIDRQSSATEKMVDLLGHFLTSVSKKVIIVI